MKKWIEKAYIRKQLLLSLRFSIALSSFLGVFIALIPFDGKWWVNAIVIASVFASSFLGATIFLLSKRKRRIGEFNGVSINVMYGDILNIGSVRGDTKPVVVIPVNSSYDYILEDNLDVGKPIVSKKTLHGKWILKLTNNENAKIKQLREDINHGIKASRLEAIKKLEHKRGNKNLYKLGSSIIIEREECTYLLFALTDFDENNQVIERTARVYSDLMNTLINEIGRCQGRDVYIPIMGVGLSLFGLEHKRAYEIIKAAIINRKSILKSSINIVIFDEDRDKISIFD